jgi:hypothetical protein
VLPLDHNGVPAKFSPLPWHLIGIGRGLTASPLPHHRTYGSRIRRFGGWSQGHHPNRGIASRRASGEFIPDARHKAQHLAGRHRAAPRQATTPLHRSGLRPTRVAAPPICYPAFRPWGASRASPAPGLLCPLLTSAGRSGRIAPPSVLSRTPRRSPVVSCHTVGA